MNIFERVMNKDLLTRRLTIAANHVIYENEIEEKKEAVQLELFSDYNEQKAREKSLEKFLEKEKSMQKAIIDIKKQFGKNAILKGMNFEKGATAIERNGQIGGHKA